MIRIYKNINTDGEHRLVGTPSNFSAAFSSNKIYETNDVGKFVQPNAREIIVPYFAEFKSASIIESVVTFTNNQNDYTFFRVTGYEFSGINNIKYYIVVDPFLTFNITVSGLLYQTSDKYKYAGKFASPAVGGQCIDKKHIYPIAGYDAQSGSYKQYFIAILDTQEGIKTCRCVADTQYNSNLIANILSENNVLKNVAVPSIQYQYTVLHIYLLPFDWDMGINLLDPFTIGNTTAVVYDITLRKYEKDYIIPVNKQQYNAEVGTITKRIKLPDYRTFYSFSGSAPDPQFPINIQLQIEYNLTIRLYVAGASILITDDFEKDLTYSPQSQYEVFKKTSENIRLGTRLAVSGASVVSSVIAQNYMGAVSGAVHIGQDVANIWANKLERDKQVWTIDEKQGNCFENLNETYGIALFYNLDTELENKTDVDNANNLYGYIPLNLIECTDDPLASPIAPTGTYIYYRFSLITDISDGNIPLDYIEEIKNDLLRGVFIMHY